MTRSRGRRLRRTVLLAAASIAVGLVGPAVAQEPSCPPNSNNPRCTGEEPGGTSGGDTDGTTGEPGRPNRSEPPPGQVEQPPPPAAESPPTRDPAPTVAPPPEEGPAPQAPAPADLGAVRALASRLLQGPGATSLEVIVDERRAGGVDGGWSVTVQLVGAAIGDGVTTVAPGSPKPGVPRPGPLAHATDAATLFTVVGQRSEEDYDASYHSAVEIRPRDDARPTITVTLFQ